MFHVTAVCLVTASSFTLMGLLIPWWAQEVCTCKHTYTLRTSVSFMFCFFFLFYSQCYLAVVISRQATPSFHPLCSLRIKLSGQGFEQLLLSREENSHCWRGTRKGATNNICLKSGRSILIRWIIGLIISTAPQSAIGQESPWRTCWFKMAKTIPKSTITECRTLKARLCLKNHTSHTAPLLACHVHKGCNS